MKTQYRTEGPITDEQHFYTFHLAHPITINCDSSDEEEESVIADNEGAEVDDDTSDPPNVMSDPTPHHVEKQSNIVDTMNIPGSLNDSLSIPLEQGKKRGPGSAIDHVSTAADVIASSAKKVREEYDDSDDRGRSLTRTTDSETDARSIKYRAVWTNELVRIQC